MDSLARRFTELSAATDVALYNLSREGTRLITEFGSAGFANRFVDPDPASANQARHSVFGFVMGFSGGGARLGICAAIFEALWKSPTPENIQIRCLDGQTSL